MDLATLLGLVAAFGVILAVIFMGGDLNQFANAPSIAIVVGGTMAVVL